MHRPGVEHLVALEESVGLGAERAARVGRDATNVIHQVVTVHRDLVATAASAQWDASSGCVGAPAAGWDAGSSG